MLCFLAYQSLLMLPHMSARFSWHNERSSCCFHNKLNYLKMYVLFRKPPVPMSSRLLHYFLFFKVQCISFYVEAFDPFGVLCRVISIVSSVFLCMQPSSWSAPFVEEAFFFTVCNSGLFFLNQNSDIHLWVDSFLGFQFDSTDECVCLVA